MSTCGGSAARSASGSAASIASARAALQRHAKEIGSVRRSSACGRPSFYRSVRGETDAAASAFCAAPDSNAAATRSNAAASPSGGHSTSAPRA